LVITKLGSLSAVFASNAAVIVARLHAHGSPLLDEDDEEEEEEDGVEDEEDEEEDDEEDDDGPSPEDEEDDDGVGWQKSASLPM
jgi:hypothetical protein